MAPDLGSTTYEICWSSMGSSDTTVQLTTSLWNYEKNVAFDGLSSLYLRST